MKFVGRYGFLLFTLILFVISLWIASSPRPRLDVLKSMPTVIGGVYGAETSDSLPSANGATSRTYRWSNGNLTLDLFRSPTHQIAEFELINPVTAMITSDDQPLITLQPNEQLRRVYMFTPRQTTTIKIASPTTTIDNRAIGVLVSDATVQPVAGWSLLNVLDLPLTLVLWLGLAWLARLPHRISLLISTLLVIGTFVFAQRGRWEAVAVQGTLQMMLAMALIALGLWLMRHWRWSWRQMIIASWLITTVLLWSPVIQYDGVGYYAYLRSLGIDGDLNFSNEFSQTPLNLNTGVKITSTGYAANPWSVGSAMLWTPFWLIAHGITVLGQQVGVAWQADGYAPPYIVMTTFATALSGLIFMLTMFAILRRWFREPIAALSVISMYCGTNLIYYALFQGGYAHAFSAMSVALMLLATLRLWEAPSMKRWIQLGLAAGLVLVTYWLGAIMLLIPLAFGVALLIRQRQPFKPWLLGGVIAMLSAFIVFLPQMYVWHKLYGSWLTIPQGSNFAAPRESHVLDMLFGSLYGVLWWTPLYFVGLLGLVWLTIKQSLRYGMMLIAAIIFIAYTARLPDWHGSGAFGMRRFTVIAPLCTLGLAAVLERLWRYPRFALASVTMLVTWTFTIMLRYVLLIIPRSYTDIQALPIQAVVLSPRPLNIAGIRYISQNAWTMKTLDQLSPIYAIFGAIVLGAIVLGVVWFLVRGKHHTKSYDEQ